MAYAYFLITVFHVLTFSWQQTHASNSQHSFMKSWSPCGRNSSDFNECLNKSLQTLISNLFKGGIEEMGVDTLEPLEVDEVLFNYDSLPDIGGTIYLNQTTVTGLSNITIDQIRSNFSEMKMSVDLNFSIPRIILEGEFMMNGRVKRFPVAGKGHFNVTTGVVRGSMQIKGKARDKDGVKYMDIKQFIIKPSMEYFYLKANNLLKGNPQLNSLIISFTSRFWQLLFSKTLPSLETALDSMAIKETNRILQQIPYDILFPTSTSHNSKTRHGIKVKNGKIPNLKTEYADNGSNIWSVLVRPRLVRSKAQSTS